MYQHFKRSLKSLLLISLLSPVAAYGAESRHAVLRLSIDEAGRVEKVTVQQSSGDLNVDNAMMRIYNAKFPSDAGKELILNVTLKDTNAVDLAPPRAFDRHPQLLNTAAGDPVLRQVTTFPMQAFGCSFWPDRFFCDPYLEHTDVSRRGKRDGQHLSRESLPAVCRVTTCNPH